VNHDLPLTPWAEGPSPGSDPVEQRAAGLFRKVEIPVRFDPRRVTMASRPVPSSRRSRNRRRAGRLGLLLAGALLGGAGLVVAARGIPPLGRWLLSGSGSDRTMLAPVPPAPVRPAPPPTAAAATTTTTPSLAPAPAPATTPAEPRARPVTGAAAPARPKPSALAEETRLLGRAFAQLHRRGDPRAALAELDAHARAFPRGLLRKEAASVRVEALLDLGQRRAALAVLRSFPFGPGERDAELRLLRGELGAAWDCPGALADFDAVLRAGAQGKLADRARQGQAACQARLEGRTPPPEQRDEKNSAR
jgi:hypothetical protein